MGAVETFHDQLVGWFAPSDDGVSFYPDDSLMGPGVEPTGATPPAGNAFEDPNTRACVMTGLVITTETGGIKTVQIFEYRDSSNAGPLVMSFTANLEANAAYVEDFRGLPGGGIRFRSGMRAVVSGLSPGTTGTARINFRRI